MSKTKKTKTICVFVLVMILSAISIAALFDYAQAAKKTKWQKMLERNNVPESYWKNYLPNVYLREYRKAVKKYRSDTGLDVETTDSSDEDKDSDDDVVGGKYPLPASSGKIAKEQHLWLANRQSAAAHYSVSGTPSSCRNGMAGGYGSFGPLKKTDKKAEKYYITMRWGYVDWVEPKSRLAKKVGKNDKVLILRDAKKFSKSGYVKIGREYVRYSSRSGNKLKGLQRGYRSSAASHVKKTSVKQVYRYKGGQWERMTRTLNFSQKKKAWYRKKKVMVTNERNGKKVVASILESGPAIWTDRVGGLSPEAFRAIGAKNNEKCAFRYVDSDTKLGPVE